MITISATAIFWFIALGLTVGSLFGLMIRSNGISMMGNIIWGVFGALVTGIAGIVLGLGDGLLFAIPGTLGMLFLANVFHQHHVEDIFGHDDREVRILPKEPQE